MLKSFGAVVISSDLVSEEPERGLLRTSWVQIMYPKSHKCISLIRAEELWEIRDGQAVLFDGAET